MKLIRKKLIRKDMIENLLILILILVFFLFVVKFFTYQNKLRKEVAKVETREVLDHKYVKNDTGEYVVLQVKYDNEIKYEKYSIYDVIFKDLEDIDEAYLKIYFNGYDKELKKELYY